MVSYAYDSGGLISSITGVKGAFTYPYTLRQEYDEFFARRLCRMATRWRPKRATTR